MTKKFEQKLTDNQAILLAYSLTSNNLKVEDFNKKDCVHLKILKEVLKLRDRGGSLDCVAERLNSKEIVEWARNLIRKYYGSSTKVANIRILSLFNYSPNIGA